MYYRLETPDGKISVLNRTMATLLQLAGAAPETELFKLLNQGGTLNPTVTAALADKVPSFGKAHLSEGQARFILEAALGGQSIVVKPDADASTAAELLPPRTEWVTATPQELDRTEWLNLPTRGDALLSEYEQCLLETLLSLQVDLQGDSAGGLWRLFDTRRLPRLTDEDKTRVQDPARYVAMLRVIDAMSLSQGADTLRDISRDQVTFWDRTHDWLTTTPWAVSHDYKVLQEYPKHSWGTFKVWLEPVGPGIRAAQTAFEGEQK